MVAMVEFDVINRLSEITVPTLIIHGSEDRILSLELAELLQQNIRNSSLRVIERAGHCPHLEKPKEFNKIITDFLNHLDRISVFKPKLVLAQL
jgi:pimeloyl-ACP methyl ester carboxylesterase